MKNQYVGDINDYGKYIILKTLSDVDLHLAVCWMLTPNDERGDGKKTSYLDVYEYRKYSPLIYDALKNIVRAGNRKVSAIQVAGMFPAKYYKQISGMSEYGGIDLLFFDPDNGFEVKTAARGKRGSSRYLFWDVVAQIYGEGHSLMVYQHFPRVNRLHFMNELTGKIKSYIGANLISHIYTGNVDFVIISQIKHQGKIETAIKKIQAKANPLLMVVR